ncbi:hypothetical protein GCM10020256_25880 [Streptomyces thermocoprophilus]
MWLARTTSRVTGPAARPTSQTGPVTTSRSRWKKGWSKLGSAAAAGSSTTGGTGPSARQVAPPAAYGETGAGECGGPHRLPQRVRLDTALALDHHLDQLRGAGRSGVEIAALDL